MNLRYLPYSLELKEPFGTAHGTRTSTEGMLVALEHEGNIGYGEVFMPPYYPENQRTMAEFFAKFDAATLHSIGDLDEALDYVNAVDVGNSGAKTALDIALHDLYGKQHERAVSADFPESGDANQWTMDNGQWKTGDPEQSRVQNMEHETRNQRPGPQYSVPSAQYSPIATSFTIGIDSIDTMVRKAREANEFKTLKIKLNGKNDIAVIEAIRNVTDQGLYVDANQGWDDVEQAIKSSESLIELGVGLIEQPFKKGEAEKAGKLRANCDVPVVADEDVQSIEDIDRLAKYYDGVNIKLMKSGGIREAYKMIRAARKNNLKVLLGCMTESSIGISAAAQLAHLADWCDLDGNLLIKNDTCIGVETIDGELRQANSPGIGITDDSLLRELFKLDK